MPALDGISATLRVAARLGDAEPFAERHRSLADCTSFDEADKGDDKVEMTIKNSCSVPVDCDISWRVVCAPGSRKRRSEHPLSTSLAIDEGAARSVEASAEICGDDAWAIDQISWNCRQL